jgi:glycerol-3-phosphate dehydrogenase subunit B
LPTAIGAQKPTALVPETMTAGDLRSDGRFVFVGLRGLKDFYPVLLAENLGRSGVDARAVEIAPPLDGEGDVSTLGFARRFDRPAFRERVARELAPKLEPGETIGFPAVLGLKESALVQRELEQRFERRVFEVPTLPPSVPGIRLYGALTQALRRAGARVAIGDAVVGVERNGERVEVVLVETAARRTPIRAHSFVLATGGFASGGLEMDSRGAVRETVLELPVAGVPEGPRFDAQYFGDHALARVGVAIDDAFRPVDADGRVVYENVRIAGATIGGALPWREKSGDGISLATGYAAVATLFEEVGAAA